MSLDLRSKLKEDTQLEASIEPDSQITSTDTTGQYIHIQCQ